MMKFDTGTVEDPFAKVKGLISDLFNRLQAEASPEVNHMSYRDEGTSKATEKEGGSRSRHCEAPIHT